MRFQTRATPKGMQIRAIQGHSDPRVDPYKAYRKIAQRDTPAYIVHATFADNLPGILSQGITPYGSKGHQGGRIASHHIDGTGLSVNLCAPDPQWIRYLRSNADRAIVINSKEFVINGGNLYWGSAHVILCPDVILPQFFVKVWDLEKRVEEPMTGLPPMQGQVAHLTPARFHGPGFGNTPYGNAMRRLDPTWASYRAGTAERPPADRPGSKGNGRGKGSRPPAKRASAASAADSPPSAYRRTGSRGPVPAKVSGSKGPPPKSGGISPGRISPIMKMKAKSASPGPKGPPAKARVAGATSKGSAAGAKAAAAAVPKGASSAPSGSAKASSRVLGKPFPAPAAGNDPYKGWPPGEKERFELELELREENLHRRRMRSDGSKETMADAKIRVRTENIMARTTGTWPTGARDRRTAIRWIVGVLQEAGEYEIVDGVAPFINPEDPQYDDILARMPLDWEPPKTKARKQ